MQWHPRNHQDALDGMLMLTLEERGAYNTILDLIYSREGPIPDDARWLSGWMGCSLRKWSVIRASLIFKGKIQALTINTIPCLMNERAAFEIENAAKRQRNLREIGAKGGRKRAENISANNENNGLGQATAQAEVKLYTIQGHRQDKEDDEDSARDRFSDLDSVSLDDIERELRTAGGQALNKASPGLISLAPILALTRSATGPPCDMLLDVIPAIRTTAARAKPGSIKTWGYFTEAITSERDRRLSGAREVLDVAPVVRPPSLPDRIAADQAEARRIAFKMLETSNGKSG